MYPIFKLFTLLLFTICISPAFSQQNTRSPYSLFGVGLLRYDGFADNAANGHNGFSYRHESNFSFANPASLSALKNSAFNTGAYVDMGRFKTTKFKQDFSNAGFNYIALGVPVAKWKSGLAFGLLPYSDVGYNILNVKDSAGVSVRNEFEGSGGLSKFNVGIGTNVWKYLSLGANYSFIFGQLDESQRRRYPGNRFMTSYEDKSDIYLKGSHLDLGLHLHSVSDTGLSWVLGVTLSGNTMLKGERNRVVYTFTEVFDGTPLAPRDTIINEQAVGIKVSLPPALNFSFTIGNHEKWQATAGYGKTMWSKYKNMYGDNSGFLDDQNYSLGFFICPVPHFDNALKTNKAKNYFKSIRYTAGFHHNAGYISAFNNKIAENGLSLGLGFPFTRRHTKPDGTKVLITSRIFLTGEFVRRGTLDNNLIQEDFFKLTLGLNLADSWFKKRLFN
ncbi:MAG: hypothetical protein ACKVQB_06925 [Bacteroidia bacterium]